MTAKPSGGIVTAQPKDYTMTRIYTHDYGLTCNAISKTADGADVEGHHYQFPELGKTLEFQHGTVPEAGINGVTNETLLAVLIHRTRVMNAKFPSRQNSIAITKMEEALMWFENRTAERKARGVEGQHVA